MTQTGPCWVFNETEGIYAWPEPFPTEDAAAAFAADFRQRYSRQGYYLTADGRRIAPEEIELLVVPE
jgi:hypothetical protein